MAPGQRAVAGGALVRPGCGAAITAWPGACSRSGSARPAAASPARTPTGPCATCGRDLPVDAGVCRPCRKQASLIAGPANKTALDLSVAAVTGHQLWFHFGRLTRAGRGPVTAPPAAASRRGLSGSAPGGFS